MTPLNWLKRNLRHQLSPEVQTVVEFVFLWQEYNFRYHREYHGTDRQAALALKDNSAAKEYYNQIKGECVRDFAEIPSQHDDNNPRIKLSSDSHFQHEVPYNAEHNSLEDFLKVIYQIRCNFLHGEKLWNEGQDIDIQLICWAKDKLEKLLAGIHYI
jgi:hypothetical protein